MAGEFGSAYISPEVQRAVGEPAFTPGSEFSGGLRSAALGMGSQLQSLGGSVARTAGYDDAAAAMEAGARGTQAEAQRYAPSVGSLRDIHGMGDVGKYAAGLAGSAIPSVGLGLAAGAATTLTGGGALAGILAGTAAYTPFEAGDIAQRQMLDPSTAGMSPGEKLARQLGGGALSAAGQSIVPAIVGGKLVGAGARTGMREGERGTLERNLFHHGPPRPIEGPMPGVKVPAPKPGSLRGALLGDTLVEGGSEAGGEALKQVATGSDKPMDWGAVGEAGVGGALIGGPLGGAGHIADHAWSAARNANLDGLKSLAERGTQAARDLGSRGVDAIKAGGQTVADAMPDAPAEGTTLGEMTPREMVGAAGQKISAGVEKLGKLAGKAEDAMDQPVGQTAAAARQAAVKTAGDISVGLKKALAGKPADINDPTVNGEVAGLTKDEVVEINDPATPPSRLQALSQKSTKAMQSWAAEKAADESLSPESRQRFQAMADDPTSAVAIAGATAEQLKIAGTAVKDATLGRITAAAARWKTRAQGARDWSQDLANAETETLQRASAEGWSEERTRTEVSKAIAAVNEAAIADQDAIDAARGGKKSRDFTDSERAIADAIGPYMKNEFVGDRDARQKLAGLFRRIFDATSDGDIHKVEALAKELRPVFGDDTGEVLRTVYEKMGGEQKDGGAMYEHVDAVEGEGTRRAQLRETVRQLLPPTFQGGAREVDGVIDYLIKVVTGKTPDTSHKGVKGHVDSHYQQIREAFGENSDKVFDALDKYVLGGAEEEQQAMPGQKGGGLDSDETAGADEQEGADYEMLRNAESDKKNPTTQYHGSGALQDPERLRQRYPTGKTDAGKPVQNKAQDIIDTLQKKHPDAMIEWVSERERTGDDSKREDVGSVRITQRPDEGGFAIDDYKHAKLETGPNARSDARVNVPLTPEQAQTMEVDKDKGKETYTLKLDAVKLARRGADLLKTTKASDGASDAQRLTRGFLEGMSQIMTDFGSTPDFSDTTIIGYVGGKPFTVANAKAQDMTTGGDKARDARTREIADLGKQLYGGTKTTTNEDGTTTSEKIEPTITDEKEREAAEKRLKKLESGEDFKVGLDQAKGGNTTPLQDVETRLREAISQIATLTERGSKDAERARGAVETLGGATKHRPATRTMGDEGEIERGGRRFAPDDKAARELSSSLSGLKLNPAKKLSKDEQESFKRLNDKIKNLRSQRDDLMAMERARADYTTEGSEGRTDVSADENIHAVQLVKGQRSDAVGVGEGSGDVDDMGRSGSGPVTKRGQMREAASTKDQKSNIAVQGERSELRTKPFNANHWADASVALGEVNSPAGRQSSKRLATLAEVADGMDYNDRVKLDYALERAGKAEGGVTPTQVAPIINELFTKYGGSRRTPQASPTRAGQEGQAAPSPEMQAHLDAGTAMRNANGVFVLENAQDSPYIAGVTPEGEIYVNKGQIKGTSFSEYMKSSDQKREMLKQMGVSPEDFAGIFANKKEVAEFLQEHEFSHVDNQDRKNYPRTKGNKADVMNPRAIAIEQRATIAGLSEAQREKLARVSSVFDSPEAIADYLNARDPKYMGTTQAQGGTPRPKAPAAQVAALDQAASSSDPALLHELSTTNDIEGLGRTAEHLAENHPDSEAAQVAADRFDTLAQDEDSAYGALTGQDTKSSEWMGNSVAVDESGKPLTLYHGTQDDGRGAHFFTTNPDIANDYAAGSQRPPKEGGSVVPAHVKLENPVPENLMGMSDPEDAVYDPEFVAWAKGQGYDGYVYQDKGTFSGELPGTNYVVFDADQVRSAFNPDTKFSRAKVTPGQGKSSIHDRAAVEQYIADVLGPKVAVMWKNMMHAGEFIVDHIGPVIKLSVNVLNPRSVAYHESLHGFFHMLHESGNHAVVRVLEKAASQQRVKAWMEDYYKGNTDVLKQLQTSAEERAAYMYQLYFNEPGFRKVLNPQATTLFQRIGRFINGVVGLWSNDERAIAIMEHFQSGAYANGIGTANVNTVMNPGTNKAVEAFRGAVEPLKGVWDKIMTTGNARLRDMSIDAVTQIADLIHIPVAGKGAEGRTGWVAAARTEAVTRINRLANNIGPASAADMADALHGLQHQVAAKTAEGQRIQKEVYAMLQELGGAGKSYMRDSGLQFGDLGKDYFPRVWDSSVIAANPKAFEAMLDKYAQKGFKLDPKAITQRLLTNDGNNFDVDTRTPGMQSLKQRDLDFISAEDADAFVSKDLYGTMTSYITQSARRGEWAKRFGAKGERLDKLIAEAKTQGATPDQVQTIDKYIKGVTGTLGDGINPTVRRWIGNALVYQNIRLLPLAIFSSIVDPMGIALRGGSIGDAFGAFKQGVKDIPRNFKKGGMNTKGVEEEVAQTLGVIENAGIMHALGSIHTQGMVSEFGRKVNDTYFRWNMMEQWNRTMRTSATEVAQRFIMRHEAGAGVHSARFIKELGLEPGDVQTIMVPSNTGKLEPRMKLFESDGLTPQQAERVRDAINKWVDGAVLRPNTADKPVYFNDPHFALITHLKQFTFSFQQTIISRVVDEAKMGNYRPAAMLASYVPISIAADFLKGMVQGGGEQPAWKKGWGPGDYVWSGVQRAGLMGTGQVGVDASTNVERSGIGGAISGFLGPTIEQLGDGIAVAAGNKRFAPFVVDAMPANALYKPYVGTSPSL